MKNRSEGVRRITQACSIIILLAWVAFIFISSSGFSNLKSEEWIIVVIGMAASYVIPQIISRVIYWVKDGFSQDKNT